IIEAIAGLKISLCARQNFIRAVMDIKFLSSLNSVINGFTPTAYEAFIEAIFISISTKWNLYVQTELINDCNRVIIDGAKKNFLNNLLNFLPEIQTGVNSPVPDQDTLNTINNVIKDYVRTVIL